MSRMLVLVPEDVDPNDDMVTVYFRDGDVTSAYIPKIVLSPGWPKSMMGRHDPEDQPPQTPYTPCPDMKPTSTLKIRVHTLTSNHELKIQVTRNEHGHETGCTATHRHWSGDPKARGGESEALMVYGITYLSGKSAAKKKFLELVGVDGPKVIEGGGLWYDLPRLHQRLIVPTMSVKAPDTAGLLAMFANTDVVIFRGTDILPKEFDFDDYPRERLLVLTHPSQLD